MILDGRDRFYQWDLDRKLIVTDEGIEEVHFCNRTDDCSLVCEVYTEGDLRLVNVPNILLQNDWRINAYAFDGEYTKTHKVFEVERRTKPADYVYTETEIKNYDDLAARVQQIEENGISDEAIENAVERYLDENDINVDLTGYATETYVDEKIEQIELTPGPAGKDGADGKDGEDYVLTEADKQEIASMVEVTGGSGEVDLTGYATEEYVDSKWEGYPDKYDVATKGYVTTSITGRGYITSEQAETLVDSKIAAIEHPTTDLTGYATESYVDEKVGAIEIPEVPSLDGYATEQYVDDAIAAIDVSGGGSSPSGSSVEEVYVGTEAPEDANIKIWVDTDEESNYPSREEIQTDVFDDAIYDMLNDSASRNKFFFTKLYDDSNQLVLKSCLTRVAVDAGTDKDLAIRKLKQGFIVYNSFASWGGSSLWTITVEELGVSGGKYVGASNTVSTSSFTSATDTFYFIHNDYLYGSSEVSKIISFFNRIIYDNTGSGLASTDIQAAITELAGKGVSVDNKTIVTDDTGAIKTALPYLSAENPNVVTFFESSMGYTIDTYGGIYSLSLPASSAYSGYSTVYIESTINGVVYTDTVAVDTGYNYFLRKGTTFQGGNSSEVSYGSKFAGQTLERLAIRSGAPMIEDYTKIPSDCVVLTSPNGTVFKLAVADDGTLSATQI